MISGDDLHITDDDVGRMRGSVCQIHRGDFFAFFGNVLHVGIEVDGDVHFFHQFAESSGQLIHAATHVPKTVVILDDGHEVHIAGGLQGGRSDILDEVFENHAELGIGQAFGNRFRHGGAVVDLAAHQAELVVLDELPEIIEPFRKVAAVNDIILLAAVIEEALEFGPMFFKIAGELSKLGFHEVVFLVKVDGGAVLKEVAPVGSNSVELDVVLHLLPGALEEVAEELRESEDGGAEVEGVAVFFKEVKFSSDPFVLFKDLDLIAGGPE